MVDDANGEPRSTITPPNFDTFGNTAQRCTPEECAAARQKKIIAGVLAIVLGWTGAHKFFLGNIGAGIIMACVSLVGSFVCAFACMPGGGAYAMALIGLIEGIIYLSMPDDQFYRAHIVGKHAWF